MRTNMLCLPCLHTYTHTHTQTGTEANLITFTLQNVIIHAARPNSQGHKMADRYCLLRLVYYILRACKINLCAPRRFLSTKHSKRCFLYLAVFVFTLPGQSVTHQKSRPTDGQLVKARHETRSCNRVSCLQVNGETVEHDAHVQHKHACSAVQGRAGRAGRNGEPTVM